MVMKFEGLVSRRTFKDVTKDRRDIVKIVSKTSPKDTITKIYECNGSVIIHSKNTQKNHASISNRKGYGYVQEWEISYMIERILKVRNKDVVMHVGQTGVIHLVTKKGYSSCQ